MNWSDWTNISFLANGEFYIGAFIMIVIVYLIGSINAGQILSLLGSKNLGENGSKSYGATNAGRIYGTWAFVLVFVFDMLKSFIAVLFCMGLLKLNDDLFAKEWVPIAISFVIIGHCWPIYFGFKGGKGVASAFGCVLALNWIFAIVAIIIFLVVKLTNGWTSNASLAGVGVGVFLAIFIHPLFMFGNANVVLFDWTLTWTTMVAAAIVGAISMARHWPNLKEMIDGKKPWVQRKEKDEGK